MQPEDGGKWQRSSEAKRQCAILEVVVEFVVHFSRHDAERHLRIQNKREADAWSRQLCVGVHGKSLANGSEKSEPPSRRQSLSEVQTCYRYGTETEPQA